MKIFLDDMKDPAWYGINADDVKVFRTGEEAAEFILDTKSIIDILYLDHDLGMGMDGYDFLVGLLEHDKAIVKKVIIISLNPAGVNRMAVACNANHIPYERWGLGRIL